MGYESRVIIAKKYHNKQESVMDIVAELNLSGMPYDFSDLFTSEWKAGYYECPCEMTVVKDKYDKVVTYTTLRKVYKWCIANAQIENYRRIDMLLAVINSIIRGWNDELGDFIVIHYGY